MDLRGEIVNILEQTRQNILANMSSKRINASGRSAGSFGVRVEGNSRYVLFKAEGLSAPLTTLEVGRPGGPVPRGFYYIIRQWTKDKGLVFNTESERGTFAYFVARKIAREGTARYTKNVDVYNTPVAVATDKIKNTAGSFILMSVHKSIKKG